MRVALVTPYLAKARNGNAHTASRYVRFLRDGGHQVELMLEWPANPEQPAPDAMIALHARRVHDSIARFSAAHPDRPLILVMTGTDLYRDIHIDSRAQQSLNLANRIVVLQECGIDELPDQVRSKAVVIHQSAPSRKPGRKPHRTFDCCVVAHLRDEKDPFRAAEAAMLLPSESAIRVAHIGSDSIGNELQAGQADRARGFMQATPRWQWLGPLPHGEVRNRIARSHMLIISSKMEGGANVIVEAITSGTPVLASDIAGNRGMLGADYAGYFPLGDHQALATLMLRAEKDASFYKLLCQQCSARAPLFSPAREAHAVQALLT